MEREQAAVRGDPEGRCTVQERKSYSCCGGVEWLWLLAAGLLSSLVIIHGIMGDEIGATFDEPFYVQAGLTAWRSGSNKLLMRAGTMTLAVDVQTLPLYLWERWRGVPWEWSRDGPQMLRVARMANLLFWWLLLFMVWRLGWQWGGPWGSRWAVTFVACEPNLLAHAGLATTDIALTACLLLFLDSFGRGRDQPWSRRVLLPGMFYGVALTAKASALVFGLQGMIVLGLWHLWLNRDKVQRTPGEGGSWRFVGRELRLLWQHSVTLRWDIVAIGLFGLVVAFAYTGCDWGPEPTFIRWAEQLPDGQLKRVMQPLSHHLTIFTNAGEALLYQIKHNIRGHGTYLNGQWYPRATPWYFPLALSMKTPLPLLGLFLVALVLAPRHVANPLAALALLMLVLSPTYRVQIGIRFLFPALVLGVIAASAALGRYAGTSILAAGWWRCGRRHWLVMLVSILLLVQAAEVWRHWPHLLCYINDLWGGPQAPDDLLHESNYDWGQGLPELRHWCQEQQVERMAVWYYGKDPTVEWPPFQPAPLSHWPHQGNPQQIRALCGDAQLLAVSVGCLRCNPDITPHHRDALRWLQSRTPLARTRLFLLYSLADIPGKAP
jgi:4-amino-4-deoxy-L-arabinose transferase-like glycosyltransferase